METRSYRQLCQDFRDRLIDIDGLCQAFRGMPAPALKRHAADLADVFVLAEEAHEADDVAMPIYLLQVDGLIDKQEMQALMQEAANDPQTP